MPGVKVTVNGVPFEVEGAKDEADAEQLVREAAQANPLLFQDKAMSLGMMFDFDTQQARERSTVNKFLIGAGKSVQDTIDMVHTAWLEQDSANFKELQALEARIAADEASFNNLGQEGQIDAVDAGEVAGDVAMFAAPGLAMTRGLWGMAKFLSPFRAFKSAGKALMRRFHKDGIDGEVMARAIQTTKGRNLVESLARIKKPTKAQMKAFSDAIRKEAGVIEQTGRAASQGSQAASKVTGGVVRPKGRNPAVKRAQERIQKELDDPAIQASNVAKRAEAARGGRSPVRAGGRAEQIDGPTPVLRGSDKIVQDTFKALREKGSFTRQQDLF